MTLYSGNVLPIANAPKLRGRPCPCCGGLESVASLRLEGTENLIVVCTTCGTGRCDPMPEPDEIAGFYPPSYYGDGGRKFRGPMEWVVRRMTSRQARRLSSGLRPGHGRLRVLDIGCGRGDLVRSFSTLGFEAHGTEIAPIAEEEFPGTLHAVADLSQASFADGTFDLVVLWHVLEHLTEPRSTLEEVRRILAPGGRLVIAVPNFSSWQARWAGQNWLHLDLPRHLFHFSSVGLRSLLRTTGFELQREDYFSLRQNPFGWVQSALNMVPFLRRNSLFEVLQRGDIRREETDESIGLAATVLVVLLAALLTPLALVLSAVAGLAREGGSMTMSAQVSATPSPPPVE